MLGDAYFQLRAQLGTGLFSLLRLAEEADAPESTQKSLRAAQARLRESFFLAALGAAEAGKSTLLNTLFEREFCGAKEGDVVGKIALFRHGKATLDVDLSEGVIECQRTHVFLRDFSVIEAPAGASPDALLAMLAPVDAILYVVSADTAPPDCWNFLKQLGRDLLRRLVFVVWQCDRVSPEEAARAVKRLRQAMLKHLGQACPIIPASIADRTGREKLERWIENEVILAEPRRARLREVCEVARRALGEIVGKPRGDQQLLDRKLRQMNARRANLAEREEQSQRQVDGALWALAQGFDDVRRVGEEALRAHLPLADFLWRRTALPPYFCREFEGQAQAALVEHLADQLEALQTSLEQSVEEFLEADGKALPATTATKGPEFPRIRLGTELVALETSPELHAAVIEAFTGAVRLLQLPLLAAVGALAVALGAGVAGLLSGAITGLAGAAVGFVVLLIFLLRRNVVAAFGLRFTRNRAALLAAIEPRLRQAVETFYVGVAPLLDVRAGQLAGERRRQEPLLKRLQQIEETFARIEGDLRAGLARTEVDGGG